MQKNYFLHLSSCNFFVTNTLTKQLVLLALLFLGTSNLFAQTFPAANKCTSKDLELVGALLPGVAPCNTCTDGQVVTRTLVISINNKTGSTRTSFALWGNLEVYNENGTLDATRSRPISVCVGPVPSNAITSFPSNNTVTYVCGQSLKITNLFLAWTDASPTSTCASLTANPSTINPKCGTLPLININAGVNAGIVTTNATCATNAGSFLVTPIGGTGPYKVTCGATIFNNVTTSVTIPNLAPGNYTITITDANNCVVSKTRTINPPTDLPTAPVSGGNQVACAQSPIQTLTATATGVGVTWYTAATGGTLVANPTLNTVGTVTYYAQSNVGPCASSRTAVTLTINATPNAPASGGNQVACAQSPVQTLTATATGSNITWHTAMNGGSTVANPSLNAIGAVTYYAQANLGACPSTRTAVSLTINANPAAPQICVTEPSLCGPSTGSISFLSPTGAGYSYSIDNGTSFQTNPSFTGLAAGSVSGIVVKDGNTCRSLAVNCSASQCTSNISGKKENDDKSKPDLGFESEVKQPTVQVAPNPFNDQVEFKVFAPKAGNGSLEVFNLVGQKIATVHNGNFTEGENLHKLTLAKLPNAHLIYKLTIDGVQVTGKLLQIH